MKSDIRLYKNLSAAVILMGLSSCTVTKYQKPEAELPDSFRNTTEIEVAQDSTVTSIAKIPYREFFTDPTLLALIESGVKNNNDLKVAIKQIEIAGLSYKQSKWGNIPTVNLNIGTASINRPSDNSVNGLTIGQFLGQRYIEDYNSNVAISWEADIWGKIKGRKEVALASYLQTQEASKAVQTQLVAQIAQSYYNLLMLDTQLDITNQNLELVNKTLKMITKQQELGITTSLSVEQQENARDQILASVPIINESITIQENSLSVLTGKMPGEIVRSLKLTDMKTPEYKSVGIPSELLSHRPDVRSSELTVRRAFSNVNVAKANMYPALNITAQGGLNAFEFKNWFDIPGSLFGTALGSLTQPLLNGKQLKTQYEQSKIVQEQSELNFKQTVLVAVNEVSNVLANIESADKQEVITSGLVLRSDKAVNTSTKLFQQDMATYLDVIIAQNNKLQAELSLANIKAKKLNSVVNLYRALGGGWN
ncbi:efflux transporter outer membrane subunit [Chryseobacterium sp. Ch-15]|uniref:Efflux transporter outer membrane subunit n=1 Tax=Chryseobacterium muglaense TaxID=2893752 RepID=A0A9Q3UXF1_9FLAO|nr:efflux transporter outer membrane subunit [Chryseobacterium muglaense]MBD3903302.1 efflux transporter outer membrane subunit [Chryseobacterium muglaense]MCC9036132.1 efflux transporter outer membrane subunit [Chryseobacterium muglaense]MCM2553292.1 efflux transporter outer membrane subunit [Chryseobacterium muglaense]